ncbi:MAG: penicillin-binding protein, partial [Polyangiaceae bacterium]|nr:penicillin-binding protein [Polyangiaceae bacterium]
REQLAAQAQRLGFNQQLTLDVQGRVGSLELPYNDLDFARAAAGFQDSKLSVFGGAQLALTVANGGKVLPMHFVDEDPDVASKRAFGTRTARRMRKAMEVTAHSGTARDSFVKPNGKGQLGPIQVAGKTGTLRPHRKAPTASWFVGFAPSQAPRIVVSVLLQNPEKWHQKGHQLARDLLAAYFKRSPL